jgi:hypothetical protein
MMMQASKEIKYTESPNARRLNIKRKEANSTSERSKAKASHLNELYAEDGLPIDLQSRSRETIFKSQLQKSNDTLPRSLGTSRPGSGFSFVLVRNMTQKYFASSAAISRLLTVCFNRN